MNLIQDVRPPRNARSVLADALQEEKGRKQWELSKVDSRSLAKELYQRGVSIADVFGVYYELEEAGDARTMNVEDAILAGFGRGAVEY